MSDKPRVCFVVNEFPRLSETFITSQITGMMARGYDVTVMCDRIVHAAGAEHDHEPFRTILRHTRTRSIAPGLLHWLHQHAPARLHNLALAASDTLCDGRMNRYDVLIAHFSHTGMRLARSHRLGILRTPFATYFHGYDVGVPLKAGRAHKFRTLFRYGALLLPVCQSFASLLQGAGADAGRMRIHRMGVFTARIPFKPHPRADVLRIVTACRHVEKKGLRYGLEALAELSRRRPDIAWRYTLIGDGPLRAGFEVLAAGLGIADRVEFTGPLPNPDVHARLAAADVFLQPSVTAANGDIEGCGVVLAEAMASGLPVISSFHSGIPELVHDGDTGLLAAERDVHGLGRHLEYVADHPAECAGMAKRARAFVEAEFDNDKLNAELEGIVKSIGSKNACHPEERSDEGSS